LLGRVDDNSSFVRVDDEEEQEEEAVVVVVAFVVELEVVAFEADILGFAGDVDFMDEGVEEVDEAFCRQGDCAFVSVEVLGVSLVFFLINEGNAEGEEGAFEVDETVLVD